MLITIVRTLTLEINISRSYLASKAYQKSSMASSSSRRFASFLFRHRSQLPIPQGFRLPFQATKLIRGIQTLNESHCIPNEDTTVSANDSKPLPNSANLLRSTEHVNIKYSANSSLKTSTRHDLVMVFTCKVCETRSVKTTCRESYEKGVVIVRCDGCNNIHLIADRLGWFGQPGSVEDFLAARGEEVMKGSADTLNLTLEDLVGSKSS